MCPTHEDSSPSLTYGRGNKGAVLTCHAGCDRSTIVEALGLKMSDLFDAPPEKRQNGLGKTTATYRYTDEAGKLLYEVLRFEPKTFRPRMADGSYSLKGERVLYRLPDVIDAIYRGVPIFVVEGEKDADAIARAGETATCNVGGAGKWRAEYTQTLRDAAEVVIVADRDEPGRAHANDVAKALREADIPVLIVEPICGKDVSDHLAAGHTIEDLEIPDHSLNDETSPTVNDPAICDPDKPVVCDDDDAGSEDRPVPKSAHSKRAGDVEIDHIEWLWPGWLPKGTFTILNGRQGDGKGTISSSLIASLTTMSPLPDGFRTSEKIRCGLMSLEDDRSRTVVPRLAAAGTDLNSVWLLDETIEALNEDGIPFQRPWVMPTDFDILETWIDDLGIRFLVIDPIGYLVSSHVDGNSYSDVGAMLTRLKRIAGETGCTILGARHLRKAGASDARDAGIGSTAWSAVSRVEMLVGRDPEDEQSGIRLLAQQKNNLALEQGSLAYKIVPDEQYEVAKCQWLGKSHLTANDIVAGPRRTNGRPSEARDAGKAFLKDILKSGPVPVGIIQERAAEVGLTWPTLERVKAQMGIEARKAGFGVGWEWFLSPTEW